MKCFRGTSWVIHLFNDAKIDWLDKKIKENPADTAYIKRQLHSECERVAVYVQGNIDAHKVGRYYQKLLPLDIEKHGELLCPKCIGMAYKHGLIEIKFL